MFKSKLMHHANVLGSLCNNDNDGDKNVLKKIGLDASIFLYVSLPIVEWLHCETA